MNKTLHFVIFASMAFIAAGCNKGDDQNLPEEQHLTVTASFADNQTKTTLQDGGTTIYWEPGDEIKIFYGSGNGRFVSSNSSLAVTTEFSGNINVAIGSSEGFSGGTYMWGLYPYRSDATYDQTSVSTKLSSSQTGKAGSFAKGQNISLAKSSNMALSFYNVCGGLRFSLTNSNVKEVVFESQGSESIAGKIKLIFEGGVPVVQEVTEGVSKITLTAPNGGTFETGKWYYIIALPGTLSSGFKMTFNTATQCATLKSSSSITFKRGVFGSLADADEGLVYKDKPGPEPPAGENIQFEDAAAKSACVEKFDTNNDGEISYEEAAAVTSIANLFTDWNTVTTFDELQYFTGISNMSQAMQGLTKLKSVAIPQNVTSLENYAFDGCTSLESLTFSGNNVISINNYALRGCIALTELELPNGVNSIGQYAFSGCTALTELELPNGVNSIGSYAFSGCSSLTAIDIPSGVTSISNYCFQNCTSLKAIGLPSNLLSINNYAFSGCNKLESVDFPSSMNSIGQYAFQNCKSIKTVNLPNSVSSLGSYVFSDCTSLESATLPSGLTSIPSGVFSGCISLYNIAFPSSLATISDNAFRYCAFFNKSSKISKIELPTTVTTIGGRSFSNARKIIIPSTSYVTVQSNSFSVGTCIYVPDGMVESYKIRTNWSNFADYIFPISSYSDEPFEMEAVDLGLSVKWASCNLGAIKPEDYGTYFAWGDVVGQLWADSWSGGGFSEYPSYELDGNNNLKPEYDAAHVNLGGKWRMPTHAEQQELIDNCTSEWTTVGGVYGRLFTSKKAGYTDKSIFLPAAGYGDSAYRSYVGSFGGYWSGSFYGGYDAWKLYFYSDYVHTDSLSRYYGRSVRPVAE